MTRRASRALLALCVGAAACSSVRYVGQAAFGQLDLIGATRPIDAVISDPSTDDRTRVLLGEVGSIKQFGRSQGLTVGDRYSKFVELDRPNVVWVITASEALSFEPKTWSFPFAGRVPYLGWFELPGALRLRAQLVSEGWDVYLRTAGAFSTLGWFNDPVLSSMWGDDDHAFGDLANILLHELTHSTVYVPGQSHLNESVASFVGDRMAEQYLRERFGPEAWPVQLYVQDQRERQERDARRYAAYQELEALYGGNDSREHKLARKQQILAQLQSDLQLSRQPNNASLGSYRVYRAGLGELAALYDCCEQDWPRFFAALRTLDSGSFERELAEELGPVLQPLVDAGCAAPAR